MPSLDPKILESFRDKEFAHGFVEELVNAYIATQIKALRNQRHWTQKQLADEANMQQERISILENVNYSSWSLATLRELGLAYDVVPFVTFEKFSNVLPILDRLWPEFLERQSRMDDLFPEENAQWTETTGGTEKSISMSPEWTGKTYGTKTKEEAYV